MEPNVFIPLDNLRHRAIYKIRSRNLLVGVWDESSKGFIGIREKMGDVYLFAEYHYDLGGTAHATEEITLDLSDDVEIREFFGPRCDTHSEDVVFTKPIAKDGDGWVHVESQARCDGKPIASINKKLFDVLQPIHATLLRNEIQNTFPSLGTI